LFPLVRRRSRRARKWMNPGETAGNPAKKEDSEAGGAGGRSKRARMATPARARARRLEESARESGCFLPCLFLSSTRDPPPLPLPRLVSRERLSNFSYFKLGSSPYLKRVGVRVVGGGGGTWRAGVGWWWCLVFEWEQRVFFNPAVTCRPTQPCIWIAQVDPLRPPVFGAPFFSISLEKIHLISSVLIRFTTTLDMLFLHDTARNVRWCPVSHGIVVHFLFLSFLFARACEIT
jgi:hypothetical protein